MKHQNNCEPPGPEESAPDRSSVQHQPQHRNEKRHRSLLKAVSWRLTGTVDTMLISFLLTGEPKLAVSIGFIEFFTKILLYYAHERVWDRIPFGRSRPTTT